MMTERRGRQEALHIQVPDRAVVEVAWYHSDLRNGTDASIRFVGVNSFTTIRLLVIGSMWGRHIRRWRVDAVYPLDPYPKGLSNRSAVLLRDAIVAELKHQYPGLEVVKFGSHVIDLETPVTERAALRKEYDAKRR